MTINELAALAGLTANDQIPVWDAEAAANGRTKKISAQNLANAIKALAALSIVINTGNWAGIYGVLNTLSSGDSVTFYCTTSASSLLSGGNYSGSLKGVITNIGSGIYDVLAMVGAGSSFGIWRIEGLTSASATPAIIGFQRYYGGATAADARASMGVTPENIDTQRKNGSVSVSDLQTGSFDAKELTFSPALPSTNYMIETECSVAGLVTSVRDKTTTGCTLVIGNLRNQPLSGSVKWAVVYC